MRLKKLSLIAAAALAVSAELVAATTTLSGDTSVSVLTGDYDLQRATLTYDGALNSTFNGRIFDGLQTITTSAATSVAGGNFVKTGNGTLEWASYRDTLTKGSLAYYNGATQTTPVTVNILGEVIWTVPAVSGWSYALNEALVPGNGLDRNAVKSTEISTGSLQVTGGTLNVTGYINQWVDFTRFYNPGNFRNVTIPYSSAMMGFGSTVLSGSAELSFVNSALNIVDQTPNYDGYKDKPIPGVLRLNFVRNLTSRVDGDLTKVPDQSATVLTVGTDSTYRIVAHTDKDKIGGVGILAGSGRFITTGGGEFHLLDNARFTGDVLVGAGSLVLDSPGGAALASASTVNLGGGGSGSAIGGGGESKGGIGVLSSVGEWRPGYAPGMGSGTLVIARNAAGYQDINNLQALFSESSDLVTSGAEVYIMGKGDGSTINIASGMTLNINQKLDGYYAGSIVGGGDIVKKGAATLALTTGSSDYRNLTIEGGKVITNIQSLGSGTVTLAGGTLSIVQNNAGTLSTLIQGAGGTLLFTTSDKLRETVTVGNGDSGTVDILTAQTFSGVVQVNNGIVLSFHAGTGNTFANASSVQLLSGEPASDGTLRQTRMMFNDTDQRLNNFYGDDSTSINLGRGTITLVQSAGHDLVYRGQITGTGNFVKEGAASVTLGGRDVIGITTDTYSGATVVKQGTLVLEGKDQVANTSGLILAGGRVAFTGNQSFGALFGQAGAEVNMGESTLTIGVSDTKLAAMLATGDFQRDPLLTGTGLTEAPAGYYLATEGSTKFTSYTADTTRAFLADKGGITDAAVLADLSYAGVLIGSGTLVKRGEERLTLTGVSTSFTGAVQVQKGTLALAPDALPNAASISVDAGARLAVISNSATPATFSTKATGAGDFEKLGSGTLTLEGTLALSGAIIGSGGNLIVTIPSGSTRAISIGSGATVTLNQAASTDLTATLTGVGTFAKSGGGVLTLGSGSNIAFDGSYLVSAGTLNLPSLSGASTWNGDITVTGETSKLLAALPASITHTGVLAGDGFIGLSAGSASRVFTLANKSAAFSGRLGMSGGTLRFAAGNNNALTSGRVDLTSGGVIDLNETTQTFSGLSGSLGSGINTGTAGSLIVSVAASRVDDYSGSFSGTGSLTKTGLGTLRLNGTDTSSTWTGLATVAEGTLIATRQAISSALVTVNAGAEFALHNEFADAPQTYANAISGAGTIGKTGSGQITLTNASAGFSGDIRVSAGELRVTNLAFAPSAIKVDGVDSVYTLVNTGTDTATAAKVTGSGSLGFEQGTLRLAASPTYAGNTLLRSGARLDLATNGVTTISGLDSGTRSEGVHDAGSGSTTVVATAGALTVNQSIDGVFDGTFTGLTSLTVQGAGKLALTNAVLPAAVTVNGGRLALAANATTDVTLASGGSLYFDTSAALQSYDLSRISGSGNLIKTGSGDLVFDASSVALNGALGVDQGTLTVAVSAVKLNGAITHLRTEGSGILELDTTGSLATTPAFAKSISGDGTLLLSGGGTFKVNDTTTLALTGTISVGSGTTLGGSFTTGAKVDVAQGAFLSPGNSPGVQNIGDATINGTLVQEINSTTADRVNVTGTLTLGSTSALDVKQDSTPGSAKAVRGQQFVILTATNGIVGSFGNADANGVVQLDSADRAASGISRVRLAKSVVSGVTQVTMTTTTALSAGATPGYTPHEGISGLLATLDAGTGVSNPVLSVVDVTTSADLGRTVNSLSPLGLGSMYAMERDTAVNHENRLRERMEQRRYDQGGYSPYEWEAFVVGGTATADNKAEVDTPTFDTRTYGGLVGLDTRLANGPVVGAAAGYDNGTATLHDNAGRITMSRVRGTAFMSNSVTSRWFVDTGFSVGYGDFSTTRDTVTGRATGATTGFDIGVNVFTGTIVPLNENLHLTPYVGASYAHHEFGGFTEKGGNGAALKVDGWSNDSLRLSAGTGLGWWVPVADMKLKLGVDVAYNHELLDTESDIDSRFVTGGPKFSTTAAALPADSISVAPNAALHFDENNSLSAGVNFEYGLDGRTYTGLNVAYRRRF